VECPLLEQRNGDDSDDGDDSLREFSPHRRAFFQGHLASFFPQYPFCHGGRTLLEKKSHISIRLHVL
jgi:hypothetical protein